MVPAITCALETRPLDHNVEEDEQALLDADVLRCHTLRVLRQPVGELDEGDLVHLAEVVEAVRDVVEEEFSALGAGVAAVGLDGEHDDGDAGSGREAVARESWWSSGGKVKRRGGDESESER